MRITQQVAGASERPAASHEAARKRKRSSDAATGSDLTAGPSGLVISVKTERGKPETAQEPRELADSLRSVWAPKFPSADLVEASAGMFRSLRETDPDPDRQRVAHRLIISAGTVQLARQQLWEFPDVALPLPESEEEDEVAALFPRELVEDEDEKAEEREGSAGRRQAIGEWSRKSRANMVRRLATLDYSPLLEAAAAAIPAMVTLTLPSDWLSVCPDGAKFQRFLKAFRRRYERDWGKLHAIWKREFQRRGAAHFHLFMPVPTTLCERTGEPFRDWLSRSWAEIVGAKGEEFEKHLKAGTGVDFAEAINMRDPRRLAIYFLKAESGARETTSKEYQHRVPKEWQGKTVGRWWGYWGLQPVTSSVELSREDWLFIARTMRRYSRARARRVQVLRPRNIIDTETGEIKKTIYRKTGVRQVFFKNGSGFQVLNDAPALASKLALYLSG